VLAIERRQFQSGGFRRIIAVSEEVKWDLVRQYAVPRERIVGALQQGRSAPFSSRLARPFSHPDQGAGKFRRRLRSCSSSATAFGARARCLLSVWSAPALSGFLLVIGDDARLSA
jgi:hypothetical protein